MLAYFQEHLYDKCSPLTKSIYMVMNKISKILNYYIENAIKKILICFFNIK